MLTVGFIKVVTVVNYWTVCDHESVGSSRILAMLTSQVTASEGLSRPSFA